VCVGGICSHKDIVTDDAGDGDNDIDPYVHAHVTSDFSIVLDSSV
jgi:hypothetical protein